MSFEFLPAITSDPFSTPSRRSFLRAVLVTTASLVLPRHLWAAGKKTNSFWFLHTETGDSWPVDDPVAWCLTSAQQPILERARERLVRLPPADGVRIIRLVTRRCKLNLIEIRPERVVVHYWGQQGQGDLRPFFKKHALAQQRVKVVLLDRKPETSTVQSGDDFLYGERLAEQFPVGLYMRKWRRRSTEEPDDWKGAPCSWSNYCWEGVEQRYIPWRVLKSAWEKENAPLCQNCDKPTLLITFGYFVSGFYKRDSKVIRICSLCRSSFENHSPWDGSQWMMVNLGEPLLPSHDIVFGRPVKWKPPSDAPTKPSADKDESQAR